MTPIVKGMLGIGLLLLFGICSISIGDVDRDQMNGVDADGYRGEVRQGEPRANFDDITQSTTRHLIENFGRMAMVEHCPEGYMLREYQKNPVCRDEQHRSLEFTWLDGVVVTAPDYGGSEYLADRAWEGGSTFQYGFTPDYTYWMYLEYSDRYGPTVWALHTRTGEGHRVMSFAAHDQIDAIRFVGVNAIGTRFAMVTSHANDLGNSDMTTVSLFDLTHEPFVHENDYTISLAADRSPNNGPFFFIDWHDAHTLVYSTREDFAAFRASRESEGDDAVEAFTQMFWNIEHRNDSSYFRYLDVMTGEDVD